MSSTSTITTCNANNTDRVSKSVTESLSETFNMMIGSDVAGPLESSSPELASRSPDCKGAVTVVMGISGEVAGSISITLSEKGAIFWTKALIDIESETVDQEVVDAVGELGNIVVGGVKRRLDEQDLKLSLPTVVRAGFDKIEFQSTRTPSKLTFQFEGFFLDILVSMD